MSRVLPLNSTHGDDPQVSLVNERSRLKGVVWPLMLKVDARGDSLRACDYESQKREAMIACNVLNRMAELGKPKSQAIVGE